MNVRERIKNLVNIEMKTEGRKQAFIAQRCGYAPKLFSEILNGYRPLRSEDIKKICEGMSISPNVIFGWDEDQTPEDIA